MLLNGIDFVVIALFFALMFGIAAACSRRAGRDAKDFFPSLPLRFLKSAV